MDQFSKLMAGLTMVQRASIVLAVLIAGGTVAAVVHYRHEDDFRPLYSAMAPEDAAAVVQKLKESGVEYRLSDSGAVVMVASARLAESRLTLASAGLPKSGRIGFELFDKTNFGATELVEHINYQRALEGELERSVMSMGEVVQARVHLTFPMESVFLDQQQPAKASVMVKLRPGAHISPQNVLAVTHLVASAVEGLSADAVAVLDMDGNLLSRPKPAATGDQQTSTEALEVRQQIERDLVNKISATLEPLLGANQFRAGASVDCDLTSGDQQEETFNPDQSVMVSSQKSEDTSEHASAGGIPGTASNLPNPPQRAVSSPAGTAHRTENVTYQTSRIVRHTRIPQGVIRKMSLSVLVGQAFQWEGTGKARHRVAVPPSADTMKTIKDLVAGITGFDANRGDQLIVETLPFESEMNIADLTPVSNPTSGSPVTGPAWLVWLTKYQSIIGMAVGGLIGLAVLLKIVLSMFSGKSKAAVSEGQDQLEALSALRRASAMQESSAGIQVAAGEANSPLAATDNRALLASAHETADRIRTLAQRDLAVTANVLRMWLQDGSPRKS